MKSACCFRRVAALCLPAALALSGVLIAPPPASAAPPAGYRMVWKDEFNLTPGSPPNPAFWTYETGASGWGNNELENYVNNPAHGGIVADPDATDKRALQITVTSDGKGGYESARLITAKKVAFQYGYVEARIRMASGQGIWPAFWMLGADIFDPKVSWPRCGEIDIMENIGNAQWLGKNLSSLHGPGYSGGDSLHGEFNLPAGEKFRDRYHVFAMLWQKDSIAFSVDGKVYATKTPADAPGKVWAFNHPFFLLANVAVGGGFPGLPDKTTTLPQQMRLDYVRLYQKPEGDSILRLP